MSEITLGHTHRGFALGEFLDRNGEKCSIQKSSVATEDCLWLGKNDTIPKVCVFNEGWKEVPLPDGALTASRMHLTQEHAAALWPMLKHFAETGDLPEVQP